jgi:hypothetical protein
MPKRIFEGKRELERTGKIALIFEVEKKFEKKRDCGGSLIKVKWFKTVVWCWKWNG